MYAALPGEALMNQLHENLDHVAHFKAMNLMAEALQYLDNLNLSLAANYLDHAMALTAQAISRSEFRAAAERGQAL